MNNENNTALATGNDLGFETVSNNLAANLTPFELFQLQKQIKVADLKAELAALPILKSSDVIGKRINLIDAIQTDLVDDGEEKEVVTFVCQDAGNAENIFCVTKSANKFNMAYVERFDARRGVMEQPMLNMVFVEDSQWEKRGNAAIVLRKWQPEKPAEKAVKTDK